MIVSSFINFFYVWKQVQIKHLVFSHGFISCFYIELFYVEYIVLIKCQQWLNKNAF